MTDTTEPIIEEYSPSEESDIIEARERFYNYVYFSGHVPVYVGKGIGKRALERSRRRPFSDWYKALNPDKSLTFRIVFAHEDEDLVFLNESSLIRSIGRIDIGTGPLFNKTDGGEGMSGIVMSEETKKKMSEARSGEKNINFGKKLPSPSQETRDKISASLTGIKRTGESKRPTCREETKKKIGDAQRGEKGNNFGKHPSDETRLKIGDSCRGENHYSFGKKLPPHTPEHNRKISESNRGENNPNFGRVFGPHSEDHKRKIADGVRKRWEEKRQLAAIDQSLMM